MQSIQLQEFHRALSLVDPFLPQSARRASAGAKMETLHSMIKKNHLSPEKVLELRIVLNRYQKSTGKSNIWLKVSLALIYSAVGAMSTRHTIDEQKQHQIPVCTLSRFSDYVDKENSSQRFRNPRLSTLQVKDGKAFFRTSTPKTQFLYPIYGMNEPAVESFFQQIESIAWAPDSEFHQLFRQTALVILQHVRNFTTPSFEHGKFKYIFNELEKTFSRMNYYRVEYFDTPKKFPISLKFMQREVRLANGEVMLIAPVTKHRVIVFYNYASDEDVERAIELARRASVKQALAAGESVHGLSFEEVFSKI